MTVIPFDFLRVNYPLPLPEYQKCNFSTDDLVGKYWSFTITSAGRLTRDACRLEDDEKIFYGLIDEMYHGELLFYCRHRSELINFAAHFWEGQLTKIEFVDDD